LLTAQEILLSRSCLFSSRVIKKKVREMFISKPVKEIVVGDIWGSFVDDNDEFDLYRVTNVARVIAGPLFNPQEVIELTFVAIETEVEWLHQYHPDAILDVEI
jgi:hypothetical protein